MAGSPYRLELALRTFELVREQYDDARMLVSGRVEFPPDRPLGEGVELLGPYTQRDAPDLYRRAHALLHTTVNDSCPSVVIEAMACGVPVVHPASGGTVELVGDEAGIGVPHPESWERVQPPEPEALAEAVVRVLAGRPSYSASARSRVVERFSLEPWLDRHADLFAELVSRRS